MNGENFNNSTNSGSFSDWDSLEDVEFAPETENNTESLNLVPEEGVDVYKIKALLDRIYGDDWKTKMIVVELLNAGEISQEEIIKDPFQRQYHFNQAFNLTYDPDNPEITQGMKKLWEQDKGFLHSEEWSKNLAEFTKAYPEIYDRADDPEIKQEIGEIVNQIPRRKIEAILDEYSVSIEAGDEKMLDVICPLLGLENNRPQIEYEKAATRYGGYNKSEHKIVVYKQKLEPNAVVKIESFGDVAKNIFGRITRKRKKNSLFNHIKTLAHETWHAHQLEGDNVDQEKRDMYRINSVYYVKSKYDGYESYCAQLFEEEAQVFGRMIKERCKTVDEEKKFHRRGKHKKSE